MQIFQNKYMKQRVHKHPLVFYIHACKPKAVTMAVSTVMTTLRILPQTLLFSFSISINYSSNPELSSSSSSFAYLIATLLYFKVSSAPAKMVPGRKIIFAFLIRESLWSSSVSAPLPLRETWSVQSSPKRTISPF